ncbi:tetratricopeptide repeat protein [Actinosynnema sp. NPDC020468]|uniref:tetratricopeptide repeat protein n=1 Tax=Actinosynnema sp. NPDC020468 TaxID=3154488 RepID=UPI00340D8915
MAVRNGHAFWTGAAGDVGEAVRLYAELVPDCVRVLGAEDRGTLFALHHRATWLKAAGSTAAAVEVLAALLPVRERVLGTAHDDTERTRLHLRSCRAVLAGGHLG